jgi:hypothetical protein
LIAGARAVIGATRLPHRATDRACATTGSVNRGATSAPNAPESMPPACSVACGGGIGGALI